MKGWSAAITALTCFAIAIGWSVRSVAAQAETDWVTLFDGRNLDHAERKPYRRQCTGQQTPQRPHRAANGADVVRFRKVEIKPLWVD